MPEDEQLRLRNSQKAKEIEPPVSQREAQYFQLAAEINNPTF